MQFFKALQREYKDCAIFTGWLDKFMATVPQSPNFHEAFWLIKRKHVKGVGTRVVMGKATNGGAIVRRPKHDIGVKSMDEL